MIALLPTLNRSCGAVNCLRLEDSHSTSVLAGLTVTDCEVVSTVSSNCCLLEFSVCISVAQAEPVAACGKDEDTVAASDGVIDKSRPVFEVGNDEAADGRLLSAAEPASTVSTTDVAVSQVADAAVKLSTPRSQQLDAAANVTPAMHKSASK